MVILDMTLYHDKEEILKKIIKLLFLGLFITTLCSCSLKTDNLEDCTIYTTSSPLKYIVNYLYGDYSYVEQIYPADANVDKYKLTKKQVKKYAKSDIFVYNGLTSEKETAKSLINKNSKLLIIDVTYGLTLQNNSSELWLSPNNYLMLAKNFKSNLEDDLTDRSIIANIDEKYNEFEEQISILDASLHELGKTAIENNKEVIVTDDNTFKYLENYGFKVISLNDENNLKEIKLKNIKNNFESKKYKYILSIHDNTENEAFNTIVANYEPTVIKVNDITTKMDDDYFNIMNEYFQNLKTIIS